MNAGNNASSRLYLPEYEIFPPVREERFHTKLVEIYQNIALRVNERQIGTYDKVETNTGQRFFGGGSTPLRLRESVRTVYEITGPIAPNASSTTAHGLTNIQFFTHIYGTAVTNVVDYRPLPYVDVTDVTNQISLTITTTDIVIVNGNGSNQIDSAVVVLEYIKF